MMLKKIKSAVLKKARLKGERKEQGFTLVEMLLVLVIVGFIIYASLGYFQQKTLQMRMDRTSLQTQQILNAGLAYYVANGKWPANMTDLQGTYLPNVVVRNPWNQTYTISIYSPPPPSPTDPTPPSSFYVTTSVTQSGAATGSAMAAANVIAGLLPFGYTSTSAPTGTQPPDPTTKCTASSTTCYLTSYVAIPGQNLNNARAVNFAGLYKHGGCVPVPQCPVADASGTPMIPQIMVVPVSVSGVNDQGQKNVYPISSFTAFATSNTGNNTPTDTDPPACPTPANPTPGAGPSCNPTIGTANAYWRVCLQVVTEKGDVAGTNTGGANNTTAWGQYATLLALTRCAVNNEPSGSTFNVFTN